MRRLLALAVLGAVAAVVVPAGDAAAARSCKKFKEQRGCRLPNPAGYAATGNVFTITMTRVSDVNGRFSVPCTGADQPPSPVEVEWPIDEKLNFPGRPRIGKTYSVRSATQNPPAGNGDVSSYEWTGKLKVTSAKKVSLTLSYESTTGNPANPRVCEGSVTKTLLRAKYL